MAEELRYFLRTALWIVVAGGVYWVVTQDPVGSVLLGFLLAGLLAFVAVVGAVAPNTVGQLRGFGPVGVVGRLLGFHERTDGPPPLHGAPELIPLSSAWPIVTAGGMVLVGLGLIVGPWLLLPGIATLTWGGIGWLTQLDR